MDKIENETKDLSTSLRKVISNWLRKNYNVQRFGEPTWKGLVEAVAASNGGNNIALAQRIAADHQGTVMAFSRDCVCVRVCVGGGGGGGGGACTSTCV